MATISARIQATNLFAIAAPGASTAPPGRHPRRACTPRGMTLGIVAAPPNPLVPPRRGHGPLAPRATPPSLQADAGDAEKRLRQGCQGLAAAQLAATMAPILGDVARRDYATTAAEAATLLAHLRDAAHTQWWDHHSQGRQVAHQGSPAERQAARETAWQDFLRQASSFTQQFQSCLVDHLKSDRLAQILEKSVRVDTASQVDILVRIGRLPANRRRLRALFDQQLDQIATPQPAKLNYIYALASVPPLISLDTELGVAWLGHRRAELLCCRTGEWLIHPLSTWLAAERRRLGASLKAQCQQRDNLDDAGAMQILLEVHHQVDALLDRLVDRLAAETLETQEADLEAIYDLQSLLCEDRCYAKLQGYPYDFSKTGVLATALERLVADLQE